MLKYFMRPDSNVPPAYSYCVGDDTDVMWNADTCIEVEPQPTISHSYDMDAKAWVLDEEMYMLYLRQERNQLLAATDKYMLVDYPISAEEKANVATYRQELRDAPNKDKLADRVLPETPVLIK